MTHNTDVTIKKTQMIFFSYGKQSVKQNER